MRRRGGVRGDGPGNGPPDLPRDERLTPRRPAAATVVVTVLSRCVDGGNGGGGDSYAAPSSANRAEAACEPMPAIVASAHRCPQGSRRARAAPCLSPVCDQRPRPARETIRVMRSADAKEDRMQRFSPPSLDHHVDVDQHCTRQREHGCAAVVVMAKRYEATRKQAQGDEPRKSAGARARAAAASAQPQSEARAKSPQDSAVRCALSETTSVTEDGSAACYAPSGPRGARFMKLGALGLGW